MDLVDNCYESYINSHGNYGNVLRLEPNDFKKVKNLLYVDVNTYKLKIDNSKSNKFFYHFGKILIIPTSFVSIAFLIMYIFVHWIAIFPLISSCFFLFKMWEIFVSPHSTAKRVEKVLQCL